MPAVCVLLVSVSMTALRSVQESQFQGLNLSIAFSGQSGMQRSCACGVVMRTLMPSTPTPTLTFTMSLKCRKFISPHLDAWTSGYLLVQEIHPEPRGMPSRWSSNHLGRRGLDIRMPAGVGLAANTKPRFDIWLSVASPRLRRAAPFASRRPRDWIPRPSRWNSNHLE